MSEDTNPEAPEGLDRGQRLSWWRKGLLVLLAVFGAATLAGVAWFVFFFTHYGDPAPKPGVVVDNRTDVALNIYVVVVGQEPVLQAVVPPRSRLATGVVCGRTEMRATAGGHLVARRGPFPTCDESEWIISSADPVASPPRG